jgi:hypothetical protein
MLLVGKPEGRRPRCRWVDNVKIDLGVMVWGCMDWIALPQGRERWRALVNAVSPPPPSSIKCWEFLEWLHSWWCLIVLSSIELYCIVF